MRNLDLPPPLRPSASVETPATAANPSMLRHHLAMRGGFTLDVRSGRFVDDGISVCTHPTSSWTFPFADWDDAAVARWLARHASPLAPGVSTLGGWLEEASERAWLEPVRVFPGHHRSVALSVGRRHGQRAVYDLRLRHLLLVDGAGPR